MRAIRCGVLGLAMLFAGPPCGWAEDYHGPLTESATQACAIPGFISPSDLAGLMAQRPAGLAVVDVREAAEFADYALPGSINLSPATLTSDKSLRAGNAPLVIVDRDGTVSAAVGAAVAASSTRPVMVLSGGLTKYYRDIVRAAAIHEVPLPQGALPPEPFAPPGEVPGQPSRPVPPSTQPSPAPQSPGQTPKAPAVKGAGC